MNLINRCPTLLAVIAVIAGMVTMFVWWLPVLILGGIGTLFWLQARRAEQLGAHLSAAGAMAASAREATMHEEEWERTIERDYRNLPGFGDVTGYFRLSGWCTRIIAGNVGLELENPREMRSWAAQLTFIGGLFGTFGRASDLGSWAAGLPVLLALGAVSVVMAMGGPRRQVVAD
jgi:hypothetical protein